MSNVGNVSNMTKQLNNDKFQALIKLGEDKTDQESWKCDRDLELSKEEVWSFGGCCRVNKKDIKNFKGEICDTTSKFIITSPHRFTIRFYKGKKKYVSISQEGEFKFDEAFEHTLASQMGFYLAGSKKKQHFHLTYNCSIYNPVKRRKLKENNSYTYFNILGKTFQIRGGEMELIK